MITSAQRQGPKRFQEDRFYHARIEGRFFSGLFLAVMDGHHGSAVSDLCHRTIEDAILNILFEDFPEAMLYDLIAELSLKTKDSSAGSTISTVMISNDCSFASVAILGDSPVVIYDGEGLLHLSPEHNVRSNDAERKSAEERGGIYIDGYIYNQTGSYGIQMSRVLGDRAMGTIISHEPETYTVFDPRWVLVASDGVFDPSHGDTNDLLAEIEIFAEKRATAEDIMEWAEKRGLKDNATALVWMKDEASISIQKPLSEERPFCCVLPTLSL